MVLSENPLLISPSVFQGFVGSRRLQHLQQLLLLLMAVERWSLGDIPCMEETAAKLPRTGEHGILHLNSGKGYQSCQLSVMSVMSPRGKTGPTKRSAHRSHIVLVCCIASRTLASNPAISWGEGVTEGNGKKYFNYSKSTCSSDCHMSSIQEATGM